MLTTNQLTEYCDRHSLSSAARQLIDHVRKSPPSRRVKSGLDNVACRYASQKMGMVIQAESHKNELPAVVGWEYDNATYEFYDQPPKIKLSYTERNGRRNAYLATADFFLIQEGFAGWVECKTEEWLQTRAAGGSLVYVWDEEKGWRCPPGEEYAASVGLGFSVRSSSATHWKTVRNLEFLTDYLDVSCPLPDRESVLRVRESLGGRAWLSLKELLDSLPLDDADTVFKMVADQLVYVRLEEDLLAEPEHTLVFRDRPAADAYRIQLESQAKPVLPALQTLAEVPGQSLCWDGNIWRILNVGNEEIFLEDSERVVVSLPHPVFEQLIKDCLITGLPQSSLLEYDQADEAVRCASHEDFEWAMYRYRCLFPDKVEGCAPKSSDRARRKWRALYNRGQELLGNGFLGLLPRIHLRGNRNRRLDAEVIKIMDEVIDTLFARPGERTLVSCWGEVRNRCTEKALVAPSEAAFRNQIKYRRGQDLKEAREGRKAAYSVSEFYWRIDQSTPRHGERPFEVGHIDHTEIDLQLVGSRKGENLNKAWLTVLLDAYTRMVLAWVILFDEPSYRSCMLVIRECIRHHGRISKTLVLDKGAEFESVYLETLLARLGSHKKTRPGSKPRFGSIIERFFGMSNDAFIHNLQGNNQALQKPRQLSRSHDPRELAVWTLPALQESFSGFLDKVYHSMEHPALGMTPKDAMAVGLAQSGLRRHVLIPYSRDLAIMCLPSTPKGTAKIDPARGIKIGYIYYWSPAFRNPTLAKAQAPIRYDPFDISVAFAWLKDHWEPCQSEYASMFQGRSEKAVAIATQELRARAKRTGDRRAINATRIAEYLRSAIETEKTLLQRKRDLENKAAQELTTKPEIPISPAEVREMEAAMWSNLEFKVFGELQ